MERAKTRWPQMWGEGVGDMPPLRSCCRRPDDREAPVLGCPPSAGPAPQPWCAQGRQLLGGLGEWDRCCDHAACRAWGHSGACSTPRLRAGRSMATGACDIGAEGVPAVLAQRSRAERDKGLCWAPSPILLQTRLPAPSPAPHPLGIAGTGRGAVSRCTQMCFPAQAQLRPFCNRPCAPWFGTLFRGWCKIHLANHR